MAFDNADTFFDTAHDPTQLPKILLINAIALLGTVTIAENDQSATAYGMFKTLSRTFLPAFLPHLVDAKARTLALDLIVALKIRVWLIATQLGVKAGIKDLFRVDSESVRLLNDRRKPRPTRAYLEKLCRVALVQVSAC